MASLEQFGTALAGFGAGFQGRGSEFLTGIQSRKDKKEQLSNERKAGMLEDNLVLNHLVNVAGDLPAAVRFQQSRVSEINRLGGDPAESQAILDGLLSGNPDDLSEVKSGLANIGQLAQARATVRGGGPSELDIARTGKLRAETAQIGQPTTPSALDIAKTAREEALTAETIRKTELLGGGVQKVPSALLANLSAPTRLKATEAFNLAGGGKDGVKAFNAQVELSNTNAQRADVPNMLKVSYPQATNDELSQLQAQVDGAKTVESGLKQAGKLRDEQNRLKKAAVFQSRAISLLKKVLDNPELNDVVGSIEGGDSAFLPRSDGEAEAIADITEIADILTADNLKLMTGVLSETDIKILRNLGSGALNRKRGEKRFREDVEELLKRLSSNILDVTPSIGGGRFKVERVN